MAVAIALVVAIASGAVYSTPRPGILRDVASPRPGTGDPSDMTVNVVSADITLKHGAKCLDGTPPAYAIRPGIGDDATKFIIFLEVSAQLTCG